MEGPDVGRAVAEERHRHRVLSLVDGGERRADGVRDAAAHDAVRAEHPDAQIVDVHAAATALAVTGHLAEQLGIHVAQVRALGDRVSVTAVGRGDDVVRAKRGHHARGNRLLPDIQMKKAGHPAALHQLAGFLFEEPDPHHSPVEIVKYLRLQRRHRILLSCCGHHCSASTMQWLLMPLTVLSEREKRYAVSRK